MCVGLCFENGCIVTGSVSDICLSLARYLVGGLLYLHLQCVVLVLLSYFLEYM